MAAYTTIYKSLTDNKHCSKKLKLFYWEDHTNGYTRCKWGKGFRYKKKDSFITDQKLIERFKSLVIPPAWENVVISPKENAHLQVVGHDAKERAQYIYHPKWTDYRNILHFYKLLPFYEKLEFIRKEKKRLLRSKHIEERELGVILTLLDEYYMRIGSEMYLENDTHGITTLTFDHFKLKDGGLNVTYKAKSNKERSLQIKSAAIERFLDDVNPETEFIFEHWSAKGVNDFLKEITDSHITAKDFRTWGGTLFAYKTLCSKKEESANDAISKAADILGNTKAVAKSSYVHPHVIEAYEDQKYKNYFKKNSSRDEYEKKLHNLLLKLYKQKL